MTIDMAEFDDISAFNKTLQKQSNLAHDQRHAARQRSQGTKVLIKAAKPLSQRAPAI